MKYLSYLLYVLVVGYAIYSLTYDTHKSWYSWILNSLTGCIYTFGTSYVQPRWVLLVPCAGGASTGGLHVRCGGVDVQGS